MGKQVELFMLSNDEIAFLSYVAKSYILLDSKAKTLTASEATITNELSIYFSLDKTDITFDRNGFIDPIASEVIQFSRSILRKHGLTSGRIWAGFCYYAISGEKKFKSNDVKDMYTNLSGWIKKNMKQSTCKRFYIGASAYTEYKSNRISLVSAPQNLVDFT